MSARRCGAIVAPRRVRGLRLARLGAFGGAVFGRLVRVLEFRHEGAELRGVGGYIIVPPSVHPSGVAYEGWLPDVDDLPEAPTTLEGILVVNGHGAGTIPVPGDDELVEPGSRHESLLAWTTSRLIAKGVVGQPALDGMRGHNSTFFKPPLPDEEVVRLWRHLDGSRIAQSERAKQAEPTMNSTAIQRERVRHACLLSGGTLPSSTRRAPGPAVPRGAAAGAGCPR